MDSGSCVNLLSEEVDKEITSIDKSFLLEPVLLSVQSVSGQLLKILGEIKIPVHIEHIS